MIEPHIPESTKLIIHYIIDNASECESGLNLGSEVPQTLAVYYLHNIDNYCKIVEGIKGYGRYMDDIYIFGDSKQKLWHILDGVCERLSALKLEINEKKTQITKLSHGYVFMQLKYKVLHNGKVVVSPVPAKITRERRKLKAYKRLYDKDKINEIEILSAYKSWRQSIIQDCSCIRSVENLDRLYIDLFGLSPNRRVKTKMTRRDLPDVPGVKNYILPDTHFTRRIGRLI